MIATLDQYKCKNVAVDPCINCCFNDQNTICDHHEMSQSTIVTVAMYEGDFFLLQNSNFHKNAFLLIPYQNYIFIENNHSNTECMVSYTP